MHFPPVKNLCPAVSGKSTECVCGGGKADTRPLQKPPVHPLKKGDTGGAWILSAPNEDNARRAECPPLCNSPASRRGADGSSFASYLLRGLPPMADFRPGGQGRFGAFLRPQCRSRGVLSPRFFQAGTWPFSGLCGTRRTASSDMIRLSGSAFSQSHSYHTASGRKSQRSAPCKTAVYVGLQYLLHHGPGAPLLFAEPAAAAADRRRGYGAAGKLKPAGMPPAQGLPRRRHFFCRVNTWPHL